MGNDLIRCILIGLVCAGTAALAQENTENGFWENLEKPSATDATSQKLIELNLKARGGPKAMEEIRNISFEGTVIQGKEDFNRTAVHAPPDLLREEIFRRHVGRDYRTVTGTNGTITWKQVVLPEKKLPNRLSGLEADLFDLEARIPFLFTPRSPEKGIFVYRGEVRYANQPAYLIHGWLPSGLELDIHIDAKTFHIVNYRHPYVIGGKTILVDRTPLGLKKTAGIWWERGFKLHIRGKSFLQVNHEEIQINLNAENSLFSEPPTNEYWLRP